MRKSTILDNSVALLLLAKQANLVENRLPTFHQGK
jgi:hypothetical protein